MTNDREALKQRLSKISSQIKKPEIESPPYVPEQSDESQDMETLEKQFEAKKKALIEAQKQKKLEVPEFNDDSPVQQDKPVDFTEVVEAYQNNGKFRTELIFQLVNLNKTFNSIDLKLGELINGKQ